MKVAAIVPAYNEAHRIAAVLSVLTQMPAVDQVVAVCDGSTDGTPEAAAAVSGIDLVKLETNRGKGGAMCAGAERTDADILVFLDADLIGLRAEHVEQILAPVLSGEAPMSVGVFRGGRFLTDIAQVFVPCISGQRAMRRELFLEVPHLDGVRSGVEMAITRYVQSQKLPVKTVVLSGVTHPMKEEKLGPWRGFVARTRMYWEIARFLMNGKTPR